MRLMFLELKTLTYSNIWRPYIEFKNIDFDFILGADGVITGKME